jgi:fumarate hydratase subunit beta
MIQVQTPITEEVVRGLRVGDEVELFGTVVTARDAGHKLMVEGRPDFIRPFLSGGTIYHCGPVMKQTGGQWIAVAAGPTTSIREEPYEGTVIKEYGVRAVIGKGGMGKQTAEACKTYGAVYLHAVGGAAVSIAESIKSIEDVFMLDEFGVPEAFWIMRVEGFKTIVTMDSTGESLHQTILDQSQKVRNQLIGI